MSHPVFDKLTRAMADDGFDALVALSPDNVTYTAGFMVPSQLTNRFRRAITVLTATGFACQIVVTVEENLARERSRFEDIRIYDQFSQMAADVLADALREAGVDQGRIAIELDFMPAEDLIRLTERLPEARFEHARDIYFAARMIKTKAEIGTLRKVGDLTEQVMGDVLDGIRPGDSETQVGARIMNAMLEGGCQAVKYQVGSGIRSGITNCAPTQKLIEADDVVRVEILGDMDNYGSNVTRTAVIGKPDREQTDIWRVLIEARDKCEALLRPGTAVADLFRTYADTCRAGGIEPTLKFLGHGIGQTIHEEPYIAEARDTVLAADLTHTMEPLYMMPGRMGFHVEDMYLITTDGFDKLTGRLVPNDELISIGG
jgi:Xaa-Pro aminopeptidase